MRFPVNLLVAGDLIIDRAHHCTNGRESAEVPGLPILTVERTEDTLGGAGRVAWVARQLGAAVEIWAPCSGNESGISAARLIHTQVREQWQPRGVCDRVTIKERHFLAGRQFGFRKDTDTTRVHSFSPGRVSGTGALAIADYGKGACTDDALWQLISSAQHNEVPIVVDPARGLDSWQRYKGATVIKCNRAQWRALGKSAAHWPQWCEWLIVTDGPQGMTLAHRERRKPVRFATEPREMDATGAGDCVTAVVACCLAARKPLEEACRLANQVAGNSPVG